MGLFLGFTNLVRKPHIDLRSDLDLGEEAFSMIYLLVCAAIWPITRFIFIKPIFLDIRR